MINEIFNIPINQIPKALAEIFANKIAITDLKENYNVTYKDLYIISLKYYSFFKKKLKDKGDIVYINGNSLEHIFLFFSCWFGGYRFVPINPKLKENEIITMIKQINPICIVYGEDFRGNIDKVKEELHLEEVFHIDYLKNEILSIQTFENTNNKTALEDDILILFTSGTTGVPKAARISIRMILYNIFQTVMYWNLDSGDSSVIHTPMFHAGGLNVLTTPLLFIGGKLYLLNKFDPEIVLNLIKDKRINLLFAVPTMFKMMIDSKEWKNVNFENMKLIISGGAPCPDIIINEFLKKNYILKQGFGMTEVGVNCFFISNEDAKVKLGSVGKPMLFIDVNLVDESGHIIEKEGTGIMWFKGPVVFNGYEGFSNESTFDSRLGFCSGDVAYRDTDGFFWIKGRAKDVIIRGGENIYPIEIEKEVYESYMINECSVVGIKDDFWGEVPTLFVSIKIDLNDNYIFELYKKLENKLAKYKLPHYIVVINDFPKNSMGKILKNELVKKFQSKEFLKIYKFK